MVGGLVLGMLGLGAVGAAAEWGFEQVTPVDKGAGVVQAIDTFQVRDDGNAMLLSSTGDFASVPADSIPVYTRYLATRGQGGWANRALDPPLDPFPPITDANIMNVLGSSANLRFVFVYSTRALAPGAIPNGANLYLRDTSDGSYVLISARPDRAELSQYRPLQAASSVKYIDNDGQSVLFISRAPLTPDAPPFLGSSVSGALYRWTPTGGIEVASVLPDSDGGGSARAFSAIGPGDETGARSSGPSTGGLEHMAFGVISDDFQPGPAYVRSGTSTRAISVSRIPGDPTTPVPGSVVATADRGRFVLFQTGSSTKLTPDTPESGGTNLYRYNTVTDELLYVGSSNESGGLMTLQMSQDGQTVAFRSDRALGGDAVEGFINFYVWRGGSVRYVASLAPGSSANDPAAYLRVLSANGRYFSFTDDSPSIAQRFGYDNSSPGCPDGGIAGRCDMVYVFDSEAPSGGALSCASCRSDGNPPRGGSGDPTVVSPGYIRMNAHQARTVADDGTVFFSSQDDLLPTDQNGLLDVYAYRNGGLRLVSRGTSGTTARFLDATPDGQSVFIATNDAIVPTDTDDAVDIYVTREDAMPPGPPPPPKPPFCTGGDCRPAGAPLASLTGPSSQGQGVADGNVKASPTRRAAIRLRGASRRGAKLRVVVSPSTAGTVSISGPGLQRSARTVRAGRRYAIFVPMKASVRRTLERRGRVSIRVRGSLTPPFGKAAVSHLRRTLRK